MNYELDIVVLYLEWRAFIWFLSVSYVQLRDGDRERGAEHATHMGTDGFPSVFYVNLQITSAIDS